MDVLAARSALGEVEDEPWATGAPELSSTIIVKGTLFPTTQSLQNPLIKEYTLNHI